MSLKSGDRLGPYEILGLIGAGGMGEVYRARDPRLGRDVAIKVSAKQFTERFDREARAIAALNHPNICTLYDVGPNYLVMEYVEGAPLKGPLPVEKAIHYAGQILNALDAAHSKGVTHRDLKPANIMVTKTGVKLLDFGLARLTDDHTMTMAGEVMGTPAYMAPEQWEGKRADARSDIYSFGCVLYEMLTGKRAAANRTEVLPAVERVLRSCLAQDPEERWQSAKDLRRVLDLARADPDSGAVVPRKRASRLLPWAIAAMLAVVAAVAFWMPLRRTAPSSNSQLPSRLDLELGAPLAPTNIGPEAILSPDGTRLVFVAQGNDGKSRLLTRRLDQAQPVELAGSGGAYSPFFSPDGQSVAFFADGKLKRTSIAGGEPVVLCEAPGGRGGTWGEDGNIVAALDSQAGLSLVPAAGGNVVRITELAPGENSHRWPQYLPGGKKVLFLFNISFGNFEGSNIGVVTLASRIRKTVLEHAGMYPRYAPDGRVLYVNMGTLFAMPFDAQKAEAHGEATALLEEVSNDTTFGSAHYDVSLAGMLLYRRGRTEGLRTIYWMDSSGATEPLETTPARYQFPRFSPDGSRLVWMVNNGPNSELWIYDWQRGSRIRLTGGHTLYNYPVWSADGRNIVFGGLGGMFWTSSDGAGEPRQLTASNALQWPTSFSPDGKRLAYSELTAAGPVIKILPLESGSGQLRAGSPEIFLRVGSAAPLPAFSPDGKWLAYADTASGRYEVYVRQFPDKGSKWLISNNGGTMPIWSKDGRQLYYRTEDGRIMVVSYSTKGDAFMAERPRVWSERRLANLGFTPNFDLTPDGKRFVVLMSAEGTEPSEVQGHVTLVSNLLQ